MQALSEDLLRQIIVAEVMQNTMDEMAKLDTDKPEAKE